MEKKRVNQKEGKCCREGVAKHFYASGVIIFGMALTVSSFIVPKLGEISQTVLWVLGQCFLFAGGVLGLGEMAKSHREKLKDHISRELDRKKSDKSLEG